MTLGPGRTMFGRESGDILLPDPEASALHAELEFTKGAVIVRDLGSRNGTWREGQRLPQFALYRGQSFRCGMTDITLVDIADASAPVAGGTASGRDEGHASSATQPSGRAAQTLSRGVLDPPSAAGTQPGTPPGISPGISPGTEGPAKTLVGVPTPTAVPGPLAGAPSAPVAVPGPLAGAPSAPVAVPGHPPLPGPVAMPPVVAPPTAGAPAPVSPAPSAPIAPVANAVIKLGDAQPRKAKRRPAESSARRGRLLKRLLVGTLVVGALGGLVFGIVSLLSGRNHAFLQKLAREMPQDTVGVLALSSPRAGLDLLGDEVPTEIREEAAKDLGFDPFDPETFTGWGIDVDAPLGVSLLDGSGMVAVSVGVSDGDALRTALSSTAATILQADEDLRWIERSFGETEGLWLDEPLVVAALRPKDRAIFVVGGDADAVSRHAKAIAETSRGQTLADRPGFGEIVADPGNLLVGLYIDGGSGRAAVPGKGMEVMAIRMGLADIDGVAMLLSDDGPRVHLSMQTIMREDVKAVTMFEGTTRKGALLEQIPGPVLAELDGVFSPDQLESSLSAASLPMGLGLASKALEEEFREQTSLDLRRDILANLDGQFGYVLRRLPDSPRTPKPKPEPEPEASEAQAPRGPDMLLFAGLRDEAAAKSTAERFFGTMQQDLDLELEQIEGTTVYVVDQKPRLSYFIHRGMLIGAVGDVDLAPLIKGDGESFIKSARIPAIERALERGGLLAGFVDLHELVGKIRQGLDPDDQDQMDQWAPVLSPLEALTLRGELDSRTFAVRWTLHTSAEHGLPTLARGLTKVAGAELAKKLARKRRRERCESLIDHIVALMKAELEGADIEDELIERRFELMDECRKDETTDAEIDCMLGAQSLDALTRCEDTAAPNAGEGDGGMTPADVLEQPEPTKPPYVEDIWPHTRPSGTATGRPDNAVNYAVPLGEDPAIRGPQGALVTVVMFGDFQCPYSQRVLDTLDRLLAKDREIRLVFRHNPLAMHDEADIAARAAIAAGTQGKFWPMHDKLYDNQHALSEANFRIWAGELGLDLARFDRDYHDSATAARVQADIATAKKFGATGTPSFFVNGRYLGGAQPLHAFEEVVTEEKARAELYVERRGNTRKRLYTDMIEHFAPEVVTAPTTPVAPPVGEKRYTIDTTGLPRRGTAGFARVEIIECGDLDCPFCQRATATLAKVLADYSGKVALLWLHNPLSFHKGAEPAARAAAAAHEQGKFWDMHDKLIDDRDKRSDRDFVDYARELGLDTGRFEADLHAPSIKARVTAQQTVCTDNDAKGTPTFFINGRLLAGAQSYDRFKEIIDQELSGGI
ncbi:MAG: thioredoxin domain-containing protein [Myxococcota bacterium]